MVDWLKKLEDKEKTLIASNMPPTFGSVLIPPSPSFNYALGGKGFVYGRCPLFYGPYSSGKSLMALMCIAQMQRDYPDGLAIYISTEYDFSEERALNVGVDLSRLLVKQTNIPKEIFDWIEKDVADLCRQGANIRIIVIDTVKAIRGPKEMNLENSEDHVMGDLSSYLQKAFKLILDTIRKYKILMILVQQVTQEFDQVKIKQGKKWNIPSGEALKHVGDYFCLFERIERKDAKIFDQKMIMMNGNEQQIGHRVKVTIEKNRLGCPYRVGEFDIEYMKGVVNQHMEICDMGINYKVVEHAPKSRIYLFNGMKWSSREEYEQAVLNDMQLRFDIYQRVLNA